MYFNMNEAIIMMCGYMYPKANSTKSTCNNSVNLPDTDGYETKWKSLKHYLMNVRQHALIEG